MPARKDDSTNMQQYQRNRATVALGLAASLAFLNAAAPPAAHAQDSRSGSRTRQAIYLGAAVGLGLLALSDIDKGNTLGAIAFGAGTAAALWAFNQERQLNRGDEVRAAMEEYNRRHGRGGEASSLLSLRAPEALSLLGSAGVENPEAAPCSLLGARPARSRTLRANPPTVTGTELQTFRMTYGAGID